MNNISTYIIEKLKLNKDSKGEIREYPKKGHNVIVLWKDDPKKEDRCILFGRIKDINQKEEYFTVTYTLNGYSNDAVFWFNGMMDKYNWIGSTAKQGILCYDLNFAKEEIEKALKEEKWEFDGYNIPGSPRRMSEKELFEITLKIINENIEENEESDY